jgi:hypothetical protein
MLLAPPSNSCAPPDLCPPQRNFAFKASLSLPLWGLSHHRSCPSPPEEDHTVAQVPPHPVSCCPADLGGDEPQGSSKRAPSIKENCPLFSPLREQRHKSKATSQPQGQRSNEAEPQQLATGPWCCLLFLFLTGGHTGGPFL